MTRQYTVVRPALMLGCAFLLVVGGHAAAYGDMTPEEKAEFEWLKKKVVSQDEEIANLKATQREQQADWVVDDGEFADDQDLFDESPADSGSGFPITTVGGYVSTEYGSFEGTESEFDQHRFIINIGSQVHERISFYSELEFEHGADFGGGDGAVEVEQAWVDFLLHDWLVFRAGAILVPFGRYNILHDDDLNDLTARPLYARRIVPTTWTEAGMGFHGDIPLPNENMQADYEIYVVNGFTQDLSDVGTRSARASLEGDNNNNSSVAGRVTFSPANWVTVGKSFYFGRYSDSGAPTTESVTGFGIDLFMTHGAWELISEYGRFDFENADVLGLGGGGEIITGEMQGAYVQLAYHFWFDGLNNTSFGSPFDDPTLTGIFRFDWAKIGLVGPTDNIQKRYTIGLNYRPIEAYVIKIEYSWNDHNGGARALEQGGADGFFMSVALGF